MKTKAEVLGFSRLAPQFKSVDAEKISKKEKKLKYAIERTAKLNKALIEDINDEIEDLKIEHASTDSEGNLVYDDKGNFKYTKEAKRSLNKDIKNLLREEVEVKSFYTEAPDKMSEDDIEFLTGFVFEENQLEVVE